MRNVVLENMGVQSYGDLLKLDTADAVARIDESEVLHPGDAALAVLVLRGVADLRAATLALDIASTRLLQLTRALVILAALTLAVAIVALVA